MLGPPKPRQLDEPMLISLDDLVPQHHFYRHLERTLDLAFVRELVRDTYAGTGRPSIVPVAFVNLQLIMFVEELRSERQLMRVIADRLILRWYLGYDLSEPLPDHSSLGRIRERYGVAIFRPYQVTGDSKYATVENIVAIEDEHIHAYVPLSAAGHRPGRVAEQDVRSDAAADLYVCPGEQMLRFLSQRAMRRAGGSTRRRPVRRARCEGAAPRRPVAGASVAASMRATWTASGATTRRSPTKAMRKRKVWVEPFFTEAKEWHGLRRFRLRGLEKVTAAALVSAAGQNLKRLLSKRGWGRRSWPSGAPGIALPSP